MDINASKMQDDTQPQGAAAAGESAQGAANKQGRTPSKIVENAFFCYSTPETIKGGASAGQTQTVEAALAVFPKSHESFLRAASSLPLKLRGWWKAPVVLVWEWLAAPSGTAQAKLTLVVGFENPSGGFKSRAPDWLASPKTRDQFRRIIQEGFRRLFPSVMQQVTEVEMQLAEWFQRHSDHFVRLHQIAVPAGKAQEYSELFASVERDVGLISPQYHKGHTEKPPTKPSKPNQHKKAATEQQHPQQQQRASPSKRPAAGESEALTSPKRPKTVETDAIVAKTTPTFAKPVVPQRVVYQQQQQQQQQQRAPGSPTKQGGVAKRTASSSHSGGPPPIIRKKDSPTLARAATHNSSNSNNK